MMNIGAFNMTILKILLIIFFLQPVASNAQGTFEKIYFFNDSIGVIDDVYPTDTCYYISGTVPNLANSNTETFFGRLDLNGNLEYFTTHQDDSSDQLSHFSFSELEYDVNGNFISSFKNFGNNLSAPRVLKRSSLGTVLADSIYSNYITEDSLSFSDGGRTIVNNQDSSIYFYYTYQDHSIVGNYNEIGVLLAKYGQNGDFIWEKRFAHPSNQQNKPAYVVSDISLISDTTLLLLIGELKLSSTIQLEYQNTGKLHFITVDSGGYELGNFTFQDGQFNISRFALFKSGGNTIYSNLVSEYSPIFGSTQPTWRYTNVITCLDDFNVLKWKDTISPDDVSTRTYSTPNEFIQSSDSSFVGAFSFYDLHYNLDSSSFKMEFQVELFNKELETGDDIWKRRFHYFPEDSMRRVDYEIYDVERANDGGYIMGGYVLSYDSLDAGIPGQYGYVIKTNCLGFLGDPEAGFSFEIDDNSILLSNESIQAGGFQWNFGDGTILNTGEDETLITHEYLESGTYSIELIANGCDGASDTISLNIDFEHTPSGYAGDGTFLTLYPNPVNSGDLISFYIGSIPEGNNIVKIDDLSGRAVSVLSIESAQTNYTMLQNFASGEYLVSLISNGKLMEVEKLIVVD